MAVVGFLFCSLQTQSRSKILYKPALMADSYGCLTTEGNPIFVVAATNKRCIDFFTRDDHCRCFFIYIYFDLSNTFDFFQ